MVLVYIYISEPSSIQDHQIHHILPLYQRFFWECKKTHQNNVQLHKKSPQNGESLQKTAIITHHIRSFRNNINTIGPATNVPTNMSDLCDWSPFHLWLSPIKIGIGCLHARWQSSGKWLPPRSFGSQLVTPKMVGTRPKVPVPRLGRCFKNGDNVFSLGKWWTFEHLFELKSLTREILLRCSI